MRTPSVSGVRREGDAFMQQLSREDYRAHAGLQPSADLQGVYARFAGLFTPDVLAMLRDRFRDAAEDAEAHRSARLLLDWQVEGQTARALAALDEREIAWESAAVATVEDGRRVPYQRMAIEIGNTRDRSERAMLDRARAALVRAELAPLRQERFQREIEYVDALEIAPGYIATFTMLSGIDLPALVAECEQFLRDTQPMWDDVFAENVRRKLHIDPRAATRADALALLRAPEFDAAFPSAAMEPAIRRQVAEMGLDPEAHGRVTLDTAERAGKRARAFCAPVRVPDEVYLVLRPHGGQADYRTFLHELGHALHFGYTRPDLPFEHRWLGDNSVTESYAMLFDHLMHVPGWLRRYTGVGAGDLAALQRAVGFEELQFLRRYSAKLIYEAALYGGTVGWDALPDFYVQTLSGATGFRYDAADAFVDVDPRFYAARYLRAWQLQAVLTVSLVERFDEDWYRNPRAGPWMSEQLFGPGQRELATELAERVADRPLGFAPLVRAASALLAA